MTYQKINIGFEQANTNDRNPLIKQPNKLFGGLKIYPNLNALYAEPIEFLSLNQTLAYVKDKGNTRPGFYILTSLPQSSPANAPFTSASNWTLSDLNDLVGGLDPQGTFDAISFDPGAGPTDTNAEVGHFYVVINSANPTLINDPSIFGGVATNISDGDWILGNGSQFEVIPDLNTRGSV